MLLRGCVSPVFCDVAPGSCLQLPDAVTLAPRSCPPLVSLYLDARCCDAGSAVTPAACLPKRVSRLSPCVSQSLRSNARCCDAGVSRLSFCVSRLSLCGRMPDAETLPLVCLDARCWVVSPSLCGRCDAGSGVVSCGCLAQSLRSAVTCLPVSPSLCPLSSYPVLRLTWLAWHPVTGVRLPSAPFCSRGSSSQAQLRSIKLET